MVSAMQGAAAVHTLLTKPERSAAALQFVRDRQREAIERHRGWAIRCYAQQRSYAHRSFWRLRSGPPARTKAVPDVRPASRLGESRAVRMSREVQIVAAPVIRGDFIDVVPALHHPSLDRPVAFLDTVSISSLLPTMRGEVALEDLQRNWSAEMSHETCRQIIQWMWARRILVPATSEAVAQSN